MKNILSCNNKTIFGKEIKDWISFHMENKTEYFRIAKSMSRYLETLIDERTYKIEISPNGTGCGEKKINKPNVILVN